MYQQPKRVVAIHDLSGFGRCSLAVIMPILSAMGAQVCPVPTAILSTHTGGLGDVVLKDLTDYLAPALAHYKKLDLSFDCIYSGFLSSPAQVDSCLEYFAAYPGALLVVDPVMGDHGKPYKTMTDTMMRRMSELVKKAGVITPNLTEAKILLGESYDFSPLTRSTAKSMLAKLSEKGPGQIIITGVTLQEGGLANIGYDRSQNYYWYVPCDYIPVSYPGTGDIFASVLTGAFLAGDSLPMAMSRASSFVEIAIKTTFSYGSDPRYGVMLEYAMPFLMQRDVPQKFYQL